MQRLATVLLYVLPPHDLQLTRSESDPITCGNTTMAPAGAHSFRETQIVRTKRMKTESPIDYMTNLYVSRGDSRLFTAPARVPQYTRNFSIEIKVVYQQMECDTTAIFITC